MPPVSLRGQRDRLTCKIRARRPRVDRSLAAALEQRPAPTSAVRLCHGDLHPGNVILGRDGPVLIDWFDVSRGDPVADVARTALLVSTRAPRRQRAAHLPGATPQLLERARTLLPRGDPELVASSRTTLARWMAVMAVARIAEGVEPDGCVAIWNAVALGVIDARRLRT